MAINTYSKEKQADTMVGKHFKVKEFACRDNSDGVKIDSVTVGFLDKIRDHFGKPVTVTSGYRTETYNKQVGGAKDSYHMKGQAADITITGIQPKEIAKFAESIGVPGIGLYDYGNGAGFVHVDSRKTKYYWLQTKKDGGAKAVATHGNKPAISAETMPVIRRGCSGYAVRIWQKIVGANVDGDFGSRTESATKAWQKKHGLTADGVVGKLTWGNAGYKGKS